MDRFDPENHVAKAVYGGSFNPFHKGHLLTGLYLLENHFTEELIYMPAGVSPFKTADPPLPGEDRIHIIEEFLAGLNDTQIRKKFSITDIELKRRGPSFTADSLREIRMMHPGQKIGFILGLDSLEYFDQWKNPEEILEYHPLLVLSRKNISAEKSRQIVHKIRNLHPEAAIIQADNPLVFCSSTEIREKFRGHGMENRKELEECLPASVIDYILKRELYR